MQILENENRRQTLVKTNALKFWIPNEGIPLYHTSYYRLNIQDLVGTTWSSLTDLNIKVNLEMVQS
jgi:hypothetical protein